MFGTIAIAGVGLIGGSFALAVRKAGFAGRILGVSSENTIRQAMELGVIDQGVSLEEAAAAADLLYLAQPIGAILKTIEQLSGKVRPGCLVTDAGSTKVRIVEHADRYLRECEFLGGHPMAGKETSGVTNAEPELFRGRPYILTPKKLDALHTPAGSVFSQLIERLGARVVTLQAEDHDRIVSLTSHLPQLASTALASALSESSLDDGDLRLAGSGLMDTTRLALSSWEIWRDILATNQANIHHALQVYIDKLSEIRDNLTTRDISKEFHTARVTAQKVRGDVNSHPPG